MHLFAYSKSWADIVAAQIAASHGTRCVGVWGYGCIVIGREFEKVVEEHWLEVNRLSGRYLHVFCLVAPPLEFIGERIAQLRNGPQSEDSLYARDLLEKAISIHAPKKRIQVGEKVRLLQDLADAGLNPGEYADFLFFDFRNAGPDIDIDVIAAKAALMNDGADTRAYLKCFQQLGELAAKAYKNGYSAEKFSRMVDAAWARRVLISKAPQLFGYIKDFMGKLAKA
jgi:hypothetical protein